MVVVHLSAGVRYARRVGAAPIGHVLRASPDYRKRGPRLTRECDGMGEGVRRCSKQNRWRPNWLQGSERAVQACGAEAAGPI